MGGSLSLLRERAKKRREERRPVERQTNPSLGECVYAEFTVLSFSYFSFSAELWFSIPWRVWFFRYSQSRKRNYGITSVSLVVMDSIIGYPLLG
jgi:hypothetical protein